MKQLYFLSVLLISVGISAQSNALHLDGNNDYVSIPDTDALDLLANDDMTIEFWFKTTDNGNFVPIINKADISNLQVGYAVSMYNGILGVAKIGDGGILFLKYAQINTTATFNDGNWHHFTAVLPGTDANDYKIYIDETLQNTTVQSNNFSGEMVNSVDLRIGKLDTDYFEGTVDELRIWNRALDPEEITNLSLTELSGNEMDLVAYYNFNQGVANENNAGEIILNELTFHENHGSLDEFSLSGTTSNWVEGFIFSQLSNQNTIKDNPVSLFPNPAKDHITISGIKKAKNYSILNVDGKEMAKGNTGIQSTVDTENLSNELYILKFEDGNAVRFMKE